jgi:hypothetical protein
MSVTKGTGDVGNTFVEVEVKRVWRKRKSKSSPKLWECGKLGCVCELPKAVWEERERAFAFPRFPYRRHFHSCSLPVGSDGLQDELVTIELRQGKGGKLNLPVAIVDRPHADRFAA